MRCSCLPTSGLTLPSQIEGEKKRVAELEAQIKAYDARAMERRRTMGGESSACCPPFALCSPAACAPGVNAARDDTELATKQTKLLENKLEMSYIKLNEAMGRNKLIREDIDNLRRERCVFEQVSALHA